MPKTGTNTEKLAVKLAHKYGAEARRPIKIPLDVMESWNSDLQSVIVLIQEIQFAMNNNNPTAMDYSSSLDGAHALAERVSEDIDEFMLPATRKV